MKHILILFVFASSIFAANDPWQTYDAKKPAPIVPEPATYAQAGVMTGVGVYLLYRRRKKSKSS